MNDIPRVISSRLLIAAQRGDGYARRRVRRLEIQAHRIETERDRPRRTRTARRQATADTRHSRRSARMALRQTL